MRFLQYTQPYRPGPRETIVHTGAGYGIVFDGCSRCVLRGLTVTGGIRDTVSEATSAAVLVRDGDVHLGGVDVSRETFEPAAVPIIDGLLGREALAGSVFLGRWASTAP